uniref:Uncharacterized protein n=1 Tax=Zea mays TaxID=4577 RepID=A0A804UCK0_MAIZE
MGEDGLFGKALAGGLSGVAAQSLIGQPFWVSYEKLHQTSGAMGWLLINSNVEVACYCKPCYWLINLASKCGMWNMFMM